MEIRNGLPVRSINIETSNNRSLIYDLSTETVGRFVDLYHKEEEDLLSFDTTIAYYVPDNIFCSEDENEIVKFLLEIDSDILNEGETIEEVYI